MRLKINDCLSSFSVSGSCVVVVECFLPLFSSLPRLSLDQYRFLNFHEKTSDHIDIRAEPNRKANF